MATLYFFHDPMCSWCWAYRPVSDRLFAALPDTVTLVKVVGGLAPDSQEPMPDDMRLYLEQTWRHIAATLGTEFNFEFWRLAAPRRSTYPACRAVIAAGLQGKYDQLLDAVQRAYYLHAMNPSDTTTLEHLAKREGLDPDRFATDIRSASTERALKEQIQFTAAAGINGFPSLALEIDGKLSPIQRDYQSVEPSLQQIDRLLSRRRRISGSDNLH